jgi:hypothetical protein
MITRRQFGKTVGTGALALGIGEVTMGLGCATVFTDIENYVPIGLQAFDLVIGLIDPALAVTLTPLINDVKSAFADVVAAINAYQNAPASQKATLIGKVSLVINVAITAIQQFWSALSLPDGSLLSTIEGVLQIILSTLAAFLPDLTGNTIAVVKTQGLTKTISFTPVKPKNAKSLKSELNLVFTSHGFNDRVVY